MADQELVYLYCVSTRKPGRRQLNGIDIEIYSVSFQDMHAVVSKVSPEEFSEDNLKRKLGDMKWLEEKALQHEKVIEEIMKQGTVIPFKFGTIFQSDQNLENMLRDNEGNFRDIITDLEGRDEWGIKVYCDIKKFKLALEKEDEKIREIEQEITSTSKGKAYFLEKKKQEILNKVLDEKISECTQDTFNRLRTSSADAKINKLLPQEVTQKEGKMVLNAAFLIEKNRIREFDDILKYLRGEHGRKGLEFDWTGPWPPYNFCSKEEKGS